MIHELENKKYWLYHAYSETLDVLDNAKITFYPFISAVLVVALYDFNIKSGLYFF